jgi:NhaP-type Na+/H+ or K+/H+ antiporter
LCLRLLGIGLPLTTGLGTLLALALFHGMSIWLALLVGAALAPTDAALRA